MRAKDKPCETDERIRENTREFEKRGSKPLEKGWKVGEQGANRSKETRGFENKEETASNRTEKKEQNSSKETREFENREQMLQRN